MYLQNKRLKRERRMRQVRGRQIDFGERPDNYANVTYVICFRKYFIENKIKVVIVIVGCSFWDRVIYSKIIV